MALLAVLVNLPVVDLSVCYLPFVRGTVFCDVRKQRSSFQCTKTGFERCTMQITIAIKGALSSVTVHLFASLWWQVVAT
ncbi:hypothetical protein T4B_15331 [Trichinella pseudospiralis]|uniref:Secreted protein n=1 Tax=Trichinella pseudospiralis TaxID=6337 RepID=A0A0V1IN19_TRIPS|nr:hypothetical protein T4B_15331 [Trichinella pseudospiralis]